MTKIKSDPKRMTAARLKQIKIFVESQDPGVPLLRSFIDDWFKYKEGGSFLHPESCRPIWFNNPMRHTGESRKRMIAGMNAMHFISKDARTVLNYKGDDKDIDSLGVNYPRLIVDHVVPVNEIHEMLLRDASTSIEEIESTLCKVYRLGVITKCEPGNNCRKERKKFTDHPLCENCRLVHVKCHQKMPDDWKRGGDVFARYEEADIDGCKKQNA